MDYDAIHEINKRIEVCNTFIIEYTEKMADAPGRELHRMYEGLVKAYQAEISGLEYAVKCLELAKAKELTRPKYRVKLAVDGAVIFDVDNTHIEHTISLGQCFGENISTKETQIVTFNIDRE